MKKNVALHYAVTPLRKYYGGKSYELKQVEISTTDKFNRETFLLLDSHAGTHIDYPAHVIENGNWGEAYPLDYLCSDRVTLIEIDCRNGENLTLDRVTKLVEKVSIGCEILLIKTGYCEVRDRDCYWQDSPVVDAELPLYLKQKFPSLKAVAFDILSVTSRRNKLEGRKCHKNFLGQLGGKAILIIEDVDLSQVSNACQPDKIYIVPFLFEHMDGSFCTILAEVDKGVE